MFGTLLHIILISQLLKLFDNIWKILHTDISNGIPFIFLFFWPYNGLDIQRGNKPLYLSLQVIFWLWRCDFHIVQNTKFQQDVQGDVLLTNLNLSVFPDITTTTIYHVNMCELTKCELYLPERLPIVSTMIYRWWC